jgi:hypothetical protein
MTTDRDLTGRVADGWVSASPFALVLLVVFAFGLRGSDILLAEMAVLFWTTSDRKGWL